MGQPVLLLILALTERGIVDGVGLQVVKREVMGPHSTKASEP